MACLMNAAFLEKIYLWPRPYLSGTDLALILPKSKNARYALVKRALQEGKLQRLRRDLYVIPSFLKKELVDTFELAPLIYGPSYVSFESALSFHGWIPEAVYMTMSACCKRKKKFETPLGNFVYHPIPKKAFPLELEQKKGAYGTVWIAKPWKALADLIYMRHLHFEDLQALKGNLRIESEDLFPHDSLELLVNAYPNARVRKVLKNLEKGLLE